MKHPNYCVYWDSIHKEYVAATIDAPGVFGADKKPHKAIKLLRKELKRHGGLVHQ